MSATRASLPENLQKFIDTEKWTFAKTMPEWPHEYIVRERVNKNLFEQLVCHIRANGSEGDFYDVTYIYFENGGLLYWTMGAAVEETTIINRCRKEHSYENRLKNGTLPKIVLHTSPRLSPKVAERVELRSKITMESLEKFWGTSALNPDNKC